MVEFVGVPVRKGISAVAVGSSWGIIEAKIQFAQNGLGVTTDKFQILGTANHFVVASNASSRLALDLVAAPSQDVGDSAHRPRPVLQSVLLCIRGRENGQIHGLFPVR